MARTKTGSTSASHAAPALSANRRGSPEAIEKRRAARMFNDVLAGRGHGMGPKLDGRTEKRRQRLLRELKEGTSPHATNAAAGTRSRSKELKPLDVLQHVQELLQLGEPLTSIRKAVKLKKNAPAVEGIVRIVERLHKAYSFRPEVYRFVGIGEDTLRSAGVLETTSKKRGASAGSSTSSKRR